MSAGAPCRRVHHLHPRAYVRYDGARKGCRCPILLQIHMLTTGWPKAWILRTQTCHKYKLFSIPWIVFAAFLGSLAAAGLLLAMNFSRVGRPQAGICCGLLLAGIAGGTVWLAVVSPEGVSSTVFLVPQMVIAYATAKSLQGGMIAEHQSQGRQIGLGMGRVRNCVRCFPLSDRHVVACELCLTEAELGTRIAVGPCDEVYYSPEATEQDALRLGEILEDELYFGDPPGTTVLISKGNGEFEISLP